jgi:hypothetical protein
MKTSAFTAILLTFVMVILVLGAAVLFLWQGRELLIHDVTNLSTEVAGANSTATAVRAYVDAREADLSTGEALQATTEAALATSEADYESSLQTRESVAASRATLAAQSATQEALLAPLEAPYVAIAYPEDGARFSTSSSVPLVITAGHPQGVDQVALLGLGDTILLPGSSDPYRVYNHRLEPPLEPGEYIITATVTSRSRLTATDTLHFTVIVPPDEGLPRPALSWFWQRRAGFWLAGVLQAGGYAIDRQKDGIE